MQLISSCVHTRDCHAVPTTPTKFLIEPYCGSHIAFSDLVNRFLSIIHIHFLHCCFAFCEFSFLHQTRLLTATVSLTDALSLGCPETTLKPILNPSSTFLMKQLFPAWQRSVRESKDSLKLVTSSESTGCVCGTSVMSAVTQVHCPLFFLAPRRGAMKPMVWESFVFWFG
jgi:hypothetical protein